MDLKREGKATKYRQTHTRVQRKEAESEIEKECELKKEGDSMIGELRERKEKEVLLREKKETKKGVRIWYMRGKEKQGKRELSTKAN